MVLQMYLREQAAFIRRVIIMHRLVSMSIEVAAASVVLIPILLLYQKLIFHNVIKTFVYIIVTLYLTAMCSLVGFPYITGLHVVFSYNFIPLAGMMSGLSASFLNILLFIPLGILVPCIWSKYRMMKKMVLLGFLTSLSIEVLQIFTFRATDVNDLITNVTGTIIGYFISRVIIKKSPQLDKLGSREGELYLLYGTVAAVMFFVQPLIYPFLWRLIQGA